MNRRKTKPLNLGLNDKTEKQLHDIQQKPLDWINSRLLDIEEKMRRLGCDPDATPDIVSGAG